MNPKDTKQPGPHHGMRVFRGLDTVSGVPVGPGPLIANSAAYGIRPGQAFVSANVPPGAPEPGRFGRIFGASDYYPSDEGIHELALTMQEQNDPSGDNPTVSLGFTFLGQFIDHDLTLDATTTFQQQADPTAIQDFRTPNLDMDNLYGSGPGVTRQLYDVEPPEGMNPMRLMLDEGREFDLPRNSQYTALIGDPRNDENFLVSQTHLAMIKFHNATLDYQQAQYPQNYTGLNANTLLFNDSSQRVRWHYQWIILDDFLPRILGCEIVQDVLRNGPKLYQWRKLATTPFMPVEFSVAAYRLGHTMLRQNYVINSTITKDLFDLPFFGQDPATGAPIQSAAEKLDFTNFFDFPGQPSAQRARKFDAKITLPVFTLPFISPTRDPPISLPERNMLRGRTFSLPSGQQVAGEMRRLGAPVRVYSNADLGISHIAGLQGEAPLWFYILKESEFEPSNGLHLGPVGGRIVAEFLISLIKDVPGNFLHDDPSWTPNLPRANPNHFTMVDLLKFAGA